MKTKYFLSMNRRDRTRSMSLVMAATAFIFAAILPLIGDPTNFFNVIEIAPVAMIPAFAAAITGASCWWLVVERAQKFTVGRFVFAGLLCGLLSHPVMWLGMMGIGMLIASDPTTWSMSGLNTFLWLALFFTSISLLITGWATAIFGALGGWLFFLTWNRHAIDRK